MMRIAFHDPRLATVAGGNEQLTFFHIRALIKAGHEITIVTRTGGDSPLLYEEMREHPTIRLVEVSAPTDVTSTRRERNMTPAMEAALAGSDRLSLDAVAFNSAAATVYSQYEFDLVVVSFIPDLCGLPPSSRYVLQVCGLPPNQAVADLEAPLLKKVDYYVSVSDFVTRQFKQLFALVLANKRVVRIYPAVANEFFRPASESEKQYDVCFVGRLVDRKGIDTIVGAAAVLRDEGIRCAIAGGGPSEGVLRALVSKSRVEHLITFLGKRGPSELARILDASRVFAYPVLLEETFAFAPLEAMARRIPVITTNLGGMAEYIRDGNNALVCAPGNLRSFTDSLSRLLSNRTLYSRLSAAGERTARQFTFHRRSLEVLRFYESIAKI